MRHRGDIGTGSLSHSAHIGKLLIYPEVETLGLLIKNSVKDTSKNKKGKRYVKQS